MKFLYVDESGDRAQTDVFVMAGCLVDAYKLRRITQDVDQSLRKILGRHSEKATELKTSALMAGKGAWENVPVDQRQEMLEELCALAANNGKTVFAAISFNRFEEQNVPKDHPTKGRHWHAAAMFIASLVQKHMQRLKNNKGLTVFIMDDNRTEMETLSDAIYEGNKWYDGLYMTHYKNKIKRRKNSKSIEDIERFDHIVNTAFSIKSNHSSLIQLSDAIAFTVLRYLEIQKRPAKHPDDFNFYQGLFQKLDKSRLTLSSRSQSDVMRFYSSIAPEGWKL